VTARPVALAIAWLSVVAPGGAGAVARPADDAPIDFVRDVRPILSQHCFACHGQDEAARKAGLSLVTFERATATLESGATAIVPGDAGASALWRRVTSRDDPMPPPEEHDALSAEEIDLLGRWIERGASYAPHWAYVAPVATPAPDVADTAWPRGDVDRFILARLEAEGLSPAPDADAVTLLRRLTYDLTGLPPTTAEIDAFLADASPRAYEHAVDRLLASPRYGERMAMYWLDLVRYADTVGYHGDQTQRIWPYRDYVIDAFNANMPFDRFTIEQLAGDLLEAPTQDQLVATGYNRLVQTSHEGGVQLAEYRAIYQADRIANVSGAWMGATIGCARCHDHKYDPYRTKDFYALGAFFSDIDDEEHLRDPYAGLNTLPTRRTPEMRVTSAESRRRVEAIDAAIIEARADLERVVAGSADTAPAVAERRQRIDALRSEREAIEAALPLTMYTRALDEPREVRVLPRGNWLDDSGPVVEPAVPEFMGRLDVEGRATRLDLARWLVTPAEQGGVGELTARVFVNRIWALLHGQGLCPSLEDFGGQGRPPTHLALLDHLALDFVGSGWDVKALVRRLVLTRTYRQSSVPGPEALARDPENLLFARQTRERLSAEMVRDTVMAVSGLLVERVGGPSVRPPQPTGHYRHLNFPPRRYEPDTGPEQWRRGLYVHWQRQFLHPMLRAFDAPTREACTPRRTLSNTPLAALALLNDPVVVEASRVYAQRLLADASGDDEAVIARAMREATGRRPRAAEIAVLMRLLDEGKRHYRASPDAARALIAVGTVPPDPALEPANLAAWTEVTRAVFNLHETITRD
jgi:hypothetical protein